MCVEMGRSYLSRSIHGSSKQQKETTRLRTCRVSSSGFCVSLEVYLSGWKAVIETDHRALAFLQSAKQLLGHLYRWALFLQRFDFNDTEQDYQTRKLMGRELHIAETILNSLKQY